MFSLFRRAVRESGSKIDAQWEGVVSMEWAEGGFK